MKITIATAKPRNRLVAAARMRRAGSHRSPTGAVRQQLDRHLRRELEQLHRHKDSP